jgi:uncharacterized protein (DUF427 family)
VPHARSTPFRSSVGLMKSNGRAMGQQSETIPSHLKAETMERTIKSPGPDHPITIERSDKSVRVVVAGEVIADSKEALELREAKYPLVFYIPRKDVNMGALQRTEHSTYCPYKGDCAYYSIPVGGERAINAVWTYEAPFDAVAPIKEYLAFYTDRVDAIEERAE